MQIDRRFYVYIHRRKTDGSIFYVGKGQGPRSRVRHGRGREWEDVASHGYSIEIFRRGLSSWCAFALEKILIHANTHHGLVNKTSGGGNGFTISEPVRKVMRLKKLGRPQSSSHAAKSRSAKLGKPQPESAREFTRRIKSKPVISSDGKIYPSATEAARQIKNQTGIPASQGNISMVAGGHRANAYGLTWSYDISKIPDFISSPTQEKKILCLETGDVFRSVQAAANWVAGWRGDANNQCISQAAREGTSAYGYRWKYTLANRSNSV